VIAIYARENGQGMAFPVPVQGSTPEPVASRPSPLTSVPAAGSHEEDNKIVQLVNPEPGDGPDGEPPRPPAGPRPALKRVK
jgi:stringent starvation protein B